MQSIPKDESSADCDSGRNELGVRRRECHPFNAAMTGGGLSVLLIPFAVRHGTDTHPQVNKIKSIQLDAAIGKESQR
jgi:hypothetical protein